MSMSTLGQGPSPRKNPSSAMGRTLLSMDVAEDKGGNLPLVVTLQIIPRNRKSTKAKKDNGENGNVWGKGCHYCIQYLVPDIAILFCLYNHSQQLEGRTDGTSTYPRNHIQEEGNDYKKGVEGDRRGGAETPKHTRGIKKSSPDHAEDQSSLVNSVHLSLIVKNTVLTVVHTLKSSSLAHSLQIHCTGLTGLRSHISWAWAEKRDLAISYRELNIIVEL